MKRHLARSCVAVLALALFGGLAMACGGEPLVVRVYDGKIVEGRYVSPDAYAAFLRGVLAEESGDLGTALSAYGEAAAEDEDDPEIFARIGEASCRLDPKNERADRAFARALALDPTYASALAAKSRCSLARGRTDEAADLARRASAQDPKNAGLEALVIRTSATRPDPAMRERAIALTLAHGEDPVAWDALIAWGHGHRDAELVARGLEGLVRAAPLRSFETERGAVALLQGGELALARRVASAVADAPRKYGVVGPRDATAARLAVDEALVRGDRDVALARATRGHVSLAEVAARALLLDKKDIATTIATALGDADPGASGAQMVKIALKNATSAPTTPSAKGRAEAPGPHVTDQPPEICALLFADRLASAAGADVARAWLAKIARTPMAPHDPLGGPLAAELAARGVLPASDLPADLRASAQHAHAGE
jgi:tetratricopeptide (TPR) repeat protein